MDLIMGNGFTIVRMINATFLSGVRILNLHTSMDPKCNVKEVIRAKPFL